MAHPQKTFDVQCLIPRNVLRTQSTWKKGHTELQTLYLLCPTGRVAECPVEQLCGSPQAHPGRRDPPRCPMFLPQHTT
ncbi:hypothetical protein LEMLEM_LOCUS21525, partial [Lemmus lemmus]